MELAAFHFVLGCKWALTKKRTGPAIGHWPLKQSPAIINQEPAKQGRKAAKICFRGAVKSSKSQSYLPTCRFFFFFFSNTFLGVSW
jgi:hypothetical protein